jgi:ketosteroid isomerase-like protein
MLFEHRQEKRMNAAEHPNATAYRRTADAFRARDFAAIRSLVAEDVVWHVPGRHSMAGEIRGLDELVAWLGRLGELGFTLREHDVFGNDEHVCALSYMGARRPGVAVEIPVTSVFHFRGGRQVERWIYPDDMDAWDTIFDG